MSVEIELNNSDHFQFLFDYKIKKEKGTANTSQLLIVLKSKISNEELHDYLMSNVHFRSLLNTSIVNPLFGKKKFRVDGDRDLKVEEMLLEKIDPKVIFQNDDVGSIPVKITNVKLESSSAILFQFNHKFIDNNGVKNLLRSFKGGEFDFVRDKIPPKSSFFNRLKSTFQVSRKMMHKWYQSKAFIHSSSSKPIDKGFHTMEFNMEETAYISSKIKRSNHVESISSVFLSACCLSIRELLLSRGDKDKDFIFQQPFDLTPRKETPYILGNRFSFIHYRITAEQIGTLFELQKEINKQTAEQIKNRSAHKFLELESIMRLVGHRLQLWMMSLPAKGKMTSFAYTYIDEEKIIDDFAGCEVSDMMNIPPVMRKPPVTFGFAKFEGKLRGRLHYDENTISKSEVELVANSIKAQLLA